MTARACFLFLFAPLALQAQLALFGPDGSHVGTSYNLGQVAANTPQNFVFRATNSSAAAITVSTLGIAGDALSIANSPSVPFVIGPGSSQALTIHFAGGPPASYSANFQLNQISVLIVVTSVPAAALAVVSGCTGPDSNGLINFGQAQAGQTVKCTFSLQNPNAQSVTVASIAVSGTAFSLSSPPVTPLTLEPGASASFGVTFTPTIAASYSGSLSVAPRMFFLTGAAVNAPLPAPILEFDAGAPASGQNRSISMRLPAPSPLAASGSVNLSFRSAVTGVSDDPAVVFTANNARSIPFTIQQGDVNINLGGQPGAVFQTGTTAGTIAFTVTANVPLEGDSTTTLAIPPAFIVFTGAVSAVARSGALDVQVIQGFDNTYSAGKMSFTFYDIYGNTIQPAPVAADFTSAFQTYFASLRGGSDFQMLVTFPVSGEANRIGSVDFTMTNSSGSTSTQHLLFINDTGQCIAVGVSEILCPQTPSP